MNKGLIFVAGVGLGALATFFIIKSKYENMYQEDVESLRELQNEKMDNAIKTAKIETKNSPAELAQYNEILKRNYASAPVEPAKKDIYIIDPDEYGLKAGYATEELNYYAGDDTLVDEHDERIEDASSMIGIEALEHFGDYEEDIIHIRNEKLNVDFEITRFDQSYAEVIGE